MEDKVGNKSKTALGLILPAIGVGLVYASYSSYYSISADSPYADKNPVINIILIAIGGLALLIGLMMLFQIFSSKKKSK
jgi:uncharacterized membrane protein YidH (DUF202 family)